jgi:FkbM family methyltransferase
MSGDGDERRRDLMALLRGAGKTGSLSLKRCRHGPMLYPATDAYVGRSLALYGEFSEAESRFLAALLQPGNLAVDAGANIGAHTLTMARAVAPGGIVLAYEPQRILYQVLCANLMLNEVDNVHARHAALGASRAVTRVPNVDYSRENNFGGVSLGAEQGEAVVVETIDGLSLRQLALLKADVEGMETELLQGATGTIRRLRPLLYVEADRKDKLPALIALIHALEYRTWLHAPPLFSADNHFGHAENVFPGIVSINLLCVPRERDCPAGGLEEIQDAATLAARLTEHSG